MFQLKYLTLIIGLALMVSQCTKQNEFLTGEPGNLIKVDKKRGEVRLSGIVQKTDKVRMNDFGKAGPALLGSKGGSVADFFVFLADAWTTEVWDGLIEIGGQSRVVYKSDEAKKHAGYRDDNTPEDYFQGDPVQIHIEWKEEGKIRRLAYEDFFVEKFTRDSVSHLKPWTPHFIMHGCAIISKGKSGCIACTHDCPGGIIGSNNGPIAKPIPLLKALWDRIPAPGTRVNIVLRPVPSNIDKNAPKIPALPNAG